MTPRDECDRLLRLIVRRRRHCQRCGGLGSQVAHIITRRAAATRCCEDNVLFLCTPCHDIFDGRHHEAMTREVKEAFVDSILGPGAMARLRDKANDGPPIRPLSLFWASELARLLVRCQQLGITVAA